MTGTQRMDAICDLSNIWKFAGEIFLLGGLIRICSVGYRLLDGTEFIGKGISPDVFVRGSIEEYVEGRDTVLGQALERLVGIVLPTQNCSGGNLD